MTTITPLNDTTTKYRPNDEPHKGYTMRHIVKNVVVTHGRIAPLMIIRQLLKERKHQSDRDYLFQTPQ